MRSGFYGVASPSGSANQLQVPQGTTSVPVRESTHSYAPSLPQLLPRREYPAGVCYHEAHEWYEQDGTPVGLAGQVASHHLRVRYDRRKALRRGSALEYRT